MRSPDWGYYRTLGQKLKQKLIPSPWSKPLSEIPSCWLESNSVCESVFLNAYCKMQIPDSHFAICVIITRESVVECGETEFRIWSSALMHFSFFAFCKKREALYIVPFFNSFIYSSISLREQNLYVPSIRHRTFYMVGPVIWALQYLVVHLYVFVDCASPHAVSS